MTAGPRTRVDARHRFRAMGVDVELFSEVPRASVSEVFAAVESEFRRLELVFSRFDPASELSALNRLGRLAAGPDLLDLTRQALAARERTGGLFDPTVHDAVVAWGYDRTWAEVEGRVIDAPALLPRCGGRVQVDAGRGVIELESGTHLDFGGIAKGYAVDRGCDLLEQSGPCLVNAGGDLAVRGTAAAPWPVALEADGGWLTLNLSSGALATSGRDLRRWCAGDQEAHHLIDAATGAPSTSDLLRSTAWAPSATQAEIVAKTLFLLGKERAEAHATAEGVPAILVPVAGDAVYTGGIR